MPEHDLTHNGSSKGKTSGDKERASEVSAIYNYTPQELRQLKEGIRESFDHMEVDESYFDDGKVRIPGFSFHGEELAKKGYMPPPTVDGRPSELVYMNNWSRETST